MEMTGKRMKRKPLDNVSINSKVRDIFQNENTMTSVLFLPTERMANKY